MRTCSKSDSREKYRLLLRLLAMVLATLVVAEVRADIVRLKSGRAINGQVRGEDDGHLIVRTLGGEEKIPSEEIAGIEVGYTGLSFCVVHKDERPRECTGVLHLIQKDSVVLGTGEALTERKELRKGEFLRVEFRKAADGQQILPVLTSGVEIEIIVKGETPETETKLQGTVVESSSETMSLKLSDGTLREFKEVDLIGGAFTPRMPQPKKDGPPFLVKMIPGAYQFVEGRWIKGSLFTIGYMGAAAGFAVAYSRARAAERDASNSLSYWLFYDQQYQTRFRYYQRVQRAIGGAALIMYGLHVLDVLWGGPEETATVDGIYFSPVWSYGNPGRGSIGAGDRVEVIRLTFRF